MIGDNQLPESQVLRVKKGVTFRPCDVSSYTTEVMEIQSDNPTFQVLVIPGDPDFVEALYELLGGTASVTVVGHISHTSKDWEHGRLFLLLDQIIHKIDFIEQELQNTVVPLLLELLRLVLLTFLGKSGSATAVEATCSHLLKYHTMMNVLYMAKTEFQKLSEVPDWAFMRKYQHKIAFSFGSDDHWGPLHMFEEIGKQVTDAALSIEREGHMHIFFLTDAGSLWVAEHVASLIKNKASF